MPQIATLVDAGRDGDDDAYAEAAVAVDSSADSIADSAPTTMSGIRAKARAAVLLWAGTEADYSDEDKRTALARSLLTDLAGMPDSTPAARSVPVRLIVGVAGRRDWR